ncbi:TATA-binding protein-associated factor 172 [Adelges cooleyi]|uniref:TATA-binding protein-associated factor 172 n=1 Tax=Adelges cooleyi TaxID=133065 RepID=UPI0021808C13|nr:TATA-binding protein-associated factor 172 [Adelges cooleyi]XP_050421404.1 TATA-binding protein-associated factor 172 [Adelges cooleyi]XP_050421405.1 TATA-binding protein-associated factor 172 [Adelges cooleyi]
MASRLDRLFVLLESASSSVTRKTAANQLGQVIRFHPHELKPLLERISTYLYSSSWDTRIAASQAIEAVILQIPQWCPCGLPSTKYEYNDLEVDEKRSNNKLSFNTFDLANIMNSSTLTNSLDPEQQIPNTYDNDIEKVIQSQQKIINKTLGLEILGSSIITSEDIMITPVPKIGTTNLKRQLSDVINTDFNKSSREENRERRKTRHGELNNKLTRSISLDSSHSGISDTCKKIKMTASNDENNDWPFEEFIQPLLNDLADTKWEIRHGAATAIREIIKHHGRGAGKAANLPSDQMEIHHQVWLEDVSLRLLCVLALDPFGDFLGDQVVAPVRETCAQALGFIAKLMSEDNIMNVINVLIQLIEHANWTTRHGGLLGLKYILVVRKDLIEKMLHILFPYISKALMDPVDDVSAVAAASLLPIVDNLIKYNQMWASEIITIIWKMLAVQDDLTTSCNNFMTLLAALFSHPSGKLLINEPVLHILPRLWSFLSHNATQVRLATMKSLLTLTSAPQLVYSDSTENIKLLQDAMRLIFFRAMIEPDEEIQNIVKEVWINLLTHSTLTAVLNAVCPFVGLWLAMTMQSEKIPYDVTNIIQNITEAPMKVENQINESSIDIKYYIGGSEAIPVEQREKNANRARQLGAEMLGLLSSYIVQPAPNVCYVNESESPVACYTKLLIGHLDSNVAMQQRMASIVISEWSKQQKIDSSASKILTEKITECMNRVIYYDEMSYSMTKLIQDANDYHSSLKHYKLPIPLQLNQVVTLEQIEQLTAPDSVLLTSLKNRPKIMQQLEERRLSLYYTQKQINADLAALTLSTKASLAGALTMLQCLPEKIRPVVKPLMESIKKEQNEIIQKRSADHLAILMDFCVNRPLCPNSTIANNLCSFLCVDTDFTPKIGVDDNTKYNLILTHQKLQQNAEKLLMKRNGSRGPGRPPTQCDIRIEILPSEESQDTKMLNGIQRRGAFYTLQTICLHFGKDLETKLPRLTEIVYDSIHDLNFSVNDSNTSVLKNNDDAAQELVRNLQVYEVSCSKMHKCYTQKLLELLPFFTKLLMNPYSAIRHMAARCIASSLDLDAVFTMTAVIKDILPLLDAADNDVLRKGAIEAVACVVDKLQFDIVPYIVLLMIPILGRLSDQVECVRKLASQCFATLIQLMPLDGAVPIPPNLSDSMNKLIQSQRQFLDQLFNPNQIEDFQVPIVINAKLRSYQQTGVNWLAFLNKYKLHGILCDDMGLGKTIQSLCILASDHYIKKQKYTKTLSPVLLPSIVVCPPTLLGHWIYEIEKFIPSDILKPLQYSGLPLERQKLQVLADEYNLFVVSYDIVRKDIEFFSKIQFNYCILDECHVIKNGKTKASLAIKQVKANHRLVLSGTPIQNSVLELWSLFDFLMPGFLGTEKQFAAKYSKPILASRDAKCSSKEQEAGVLAMEALHRQVLPFVLRRMKEDVLSDLPPKITQDYYCDLSSVQQQLYEDFSKTHIHKQVSETTDDASHSTNKNNMLQALRYLQNVCNHPKLVLTPQHPQYSVIIEQIKKANSTLTDIQHAAKLPALKQLLLDCGIGLASSDEPVINQHRALIFCQLKAMLDIIENDLFKVHLPSVCYLRLDGSVPVSQRYSLVNRFNTDPSIDLLIMTTQVGGLGLNLTGADTVIFVEHDWSPMRDLQAMDRAHRIGQKKVVNVYRLITRSTLEEKIMNFQKFKLKTANTVITSENSSLQTMGTDKLLDLFSLDRSPKDKNKPTSLSSNSIKSVLENLPELWDTKIYEEEYDINSFVQTLNN